MNNDKFTFFINMIDADDYKEQIKAIIDSINDLEELRTIYSYMFGYICKEGGQTDDK